MAHPRGGRGGRCAFWTILRWLLILAMAFTAAALIARSWDLSQLQVDEHQAGMQLAVPVLPVTAQRAPGNPEPRLAPAAEEEAPEEEAPVEPPEEPAPPPPVQDEPFQQYCQDCCNDGERFVGCFDVVACAKELPKDGKYAFVLSHFGRPNARFKFLPFIKSWRKQVLANPGIQIDILLLITKKDAAYLQPEHHQQMKDNNVQFVHVDWNVPPGMMYKGQSPHNHFREDGSDWCGPQDLMRLHAFNLVTYDAVAYFDSDIEFQGDVLPTLRCAATGRFITTGGGIGVPLNIGFFALRPDARLMEASKVFAVENNYSKETGWGNSGWAPSRLKYAGGECGQGFVHTLLYKRKSQPALSALERAGFAPGAIQAVQIDKCVWNYQTSFQCPKDFDCGLVRAHHKPKKVGNNPKECLKRHMQHLRNGSGSARA